MALSNKEEYVKMVCHFLAEGLRTRRIGIRRAEEIAEKVLAHVNVIDSESDFLHLVKELAHDFDEMISFENKLLLGRVTKERRELENKAQEYAIRMLPVDPVKAMGALKDACKDGTTMDAMRLKYPDF
jgi:hypothetical protein